MYQAIFPEGQIECESYEETENGIELYDGENQLLAFVPYESLHVLINDDTYRSEEDTDAAIV